MSTLSQTNIIPFRAAGTLRKNNVQSCIFCGGTNEVKKFKKQTVCSTCLQQISTLFLHKRVEH